MADWTCHVVFSRDKAVECITAAVAQRIAKTGTVAPIIGAIKFHCARVIVTLVAFNVEPTCHKMPPTDDPTELAGSVADELNRHVVSVTSMVEAFVMLVLSQNIPVMV